MRVKKYRANSMPEAMSIIRTDLGPDAVILHSEKKRAGGLWGFFRSPVLEVTAAIDTDLKDFPQPSKAAIDDIQTMQQELTNLKTTLAQVAERQKETNNGALQSTAHPSGYRTPPRIATLDEWYRRLLEQGVSTELTQQIIQNVTDELSRWALDNENVLNEHLHWHLGKRLAPAAPLLLGTERPKVFFIVGSTGVGKTTTIAKLAANFSRRQKARVLMITCDTFRVAAIPQMTAFGDILGIPVEVAYTPQQLADLVKANRHMDLILVDTPGRSQKATDELDELGKFLAAIPQKTVHLALSAGTKHQDMRQIVKQFGTMPLHGFIITKTDETVSLGAAYTLACETEVPLSYLTTGQCVPEDIAVASADLVIDMLVGSVPDEIRSTRPQLTRRMNDAGK